jgi:glutaredoxin
MSKLELFYTDLCPYCKGILSYIDENILDITKKNIRNEIEFANELIQLGGKRQVPALKVDGHIMYESSDILQWLKENHAS